MTWIYYGSQLQFLNTLVRLVSNVFPSRRDREEEREHQTVISWGWIGRGVGEAVPERVSSDGAQTFLMEYLSWKYSPWKILPQGALCQLQRGWEPWWVRVCLLCGFEGGEAQAGCGGYKVSMLTFYDSSGDPQGCKKVCLGHLFWWGYGGIEQAPVKVGEKCS